MATEAMMSGFTIRSVCATAQWLTKHVGLMKGVECYEVSEAELERLSNFKHPNQVWMLVERRDLSTLATRQASLILALDRMQDPGNMGTLLRTADWFGIRHVVCTADTAGCYNPKVVQASMGAVFRTYVEYTDLPRWLATCGMPVYGATLQGHPLTEIENPRTTAVLLVGNESRGISPEAMAFVTHPILIPNLGGTAESLNAGVAAGILMNWMSTERL